MGTLAEEAPRVNARAELKMRLGKHVDTKSGPRRFSLQPPNLSSCTKREIRDYFLNSYDLYEDLFSALQDEATFYKQPDKLRLQLIFYLGHTSAVYVNKLMLAGELKDRECGFMDLQFETGVDEMVWDSTDQCRLGGEFNWPRVQQVWQYRHDVKQTILNLIEKEPLELPLVHKDPWWALMLGIEHERIHLETSSVLFRQLPVDLLKAPQNWHYAPTISCTSVNRIDEDDALENPFIQVEATEVNLGKPEDFPSFGWDNEYGAMSVKVPEFEARQFLTSNGEFLDFVKAGGYNKRQYWSEEGWKWRCRRQAQHPSFWVCTDLCKSGCDGELATYSHCSESVGGQVGTFRYRAMFDVIDMPWNWPAETNYHEAHAYCRWLGDDCRVIAEAEFVAIRDQPELPSQRVGMDVDVIYRKNVMDKFNLNMAFCSSTPVDYYPANSAGFHDTMGNVWQWCEDHFNGLPGAKFDYLYHDFSTPYYDGFHNTILGGSWISTGDSASSFARFWFRRHFFQHMGFRVVRSTNTPPVQLISTPVYQPQRGFIHTDVQVARFPAELKVASFTPEFALEGDEYVRRQLQWDFGQPARSKPWDENYIIRHISDFHTDRVLSPASSKLVPQGTISSLPSSAFWSDVSDTLADCTRQIKRCEHRALVIGSGTGRLAMEVAKYYDNVLGIHPVARSIEIAKLLQQGKALKGSAIDGVQLDGLVVPHKTFPTINFKQFLWVPLEMGQFDLVVLALLDLVACPEYWIARLAHTVSKTGVAMVLSSKYGVEELMPVLTCARLSLLTSTRLEHDFPLVVSEADEIEHNGKTDIHVSLWTHAAQ